MKRLTTRTTAALALGLGLTLALLYVLSVNPRSVLADPGDLFVKTDGAGSACTQDTPCTLQTALAQATGGDTIYVAQGTYTATGAAVVTVTQSITLAGGWDGAPTGDVVRDPDTYPTTLDGEGQRRGVFISGDITPTLDGFIITGGNANNATTNPGHGGGIYSSGASPIVTNNVITDNLASSSIDTYGEGGGVYLVTASATAIISGNTIISNTASTGYIGYGGGIFLNESDATVEGNRVLSNTGSTTDNGHGGGICVFLHHPLIVNNTIRWNRGSTAIGTSGRGGGLILFNTSALVESNLVANNRTNPSGTSHGGGISSFDSSLTLNGNRILSNTAASGGGISIFRSASLTLTNNIIAQNTSQGLNVEGFALQPATGVLVNNTIAHNSSDGVFLYNHVALTMTNNIIAGNGMGIGTTPITTATLDYTLFFDNTSSDTGGTGSISSTNEITGSDPLFVDPAGWDYHILPGSPAIDAGITVPWLVADIDGDARPWPVGGGYDIGADEARWLSVHLPLILRNAP